MADVIIRQAVPADAEDIYEIERICFPDPWSRSSIQYELEENERAFYLVAEHSGKVVGYAGLWWILDEGHITNVAVQPGYRNRKIAEGIISVLIEHTTQSGILHHTLEVRRDNAPAIGLYEKFGFRVYGERKGYYQFDGEDALIMWRHATKEEIAAWEEIQAAQEAAEAAKAEAEKTEASQEEAETAQAEAKQAEAPQEKTEETDKQEKAAGQTRPRAKQRIVRRKQRSKK